jgi:hypothetical protein
VFGLDAILRIVLTILLPPRDNQKRYRFTPPLSNWRICEAVSVDALCGFGAKIFIRCTESIQLGGSRSMSASLCFGHFSAFCGIAGSLMVRFAEKWFIPGRSCVHYRNLEGIAAWLVVKLAPFAGMLPSSRLVRDLSGWALS